MTVQWMRAWDLVVGAVGVGLRVNELHISFKITKTSIGKPNEATIKIYNLSPQNENLLADEYTDVVLNAGYQGNLGLIFKGTITLVMRERQGADTIAELTCGDGDDDYRNAVLNTTLASNTTDQHVVNAALATFQTTVSGNVQLGAQSRARGRVLTGPTRNTLEAIARQNGCNWSIQDGQLQVLPTSALLPGQAIVVAPETGMIGSPSVTDKGFKVKTLLNPQYKIGGAIQINSAYAQLKSKKLNKASARTRLPPNGLCKIVSITHEGDTRGNDWYSEIEAVAL